MIGLFVSSVAALRSSLYVTFRRNIGISAVILQKVKDPIQQLFADKIREYGQKSKSAGGKFVDSTPEIEKELSEELDRLQRQYGMSKGVDPTKLPDFTFKDPVIDPINLETK